MFFSEPAMFRVLFLVLRFGWLCAEAHEQQTHQGPTTALPPIYNVRRGVGLSSSEGRVYDALFGATNSKSRDRKKNTAETRKLCYRDVRPDSVAQVTRQNAHAQPNYHVEPRRGRGRGTISDLYLCRTQSGASRSGVTSALLRWVTYCSRPFSLCCLSARSSHHVPSWPLPQLSFPTVGSCCKIS